MSASEANCTACTFINCVIFTHLHSFTFFLFVSPEQVFKMLLIILRIGFNIKGCAWDNLGQDTQSRHAMKTLDIGIP